MTCACDDRPFRLLNQLVGWDVDAAEGLVITGAGAVELEPLDDAAVAVLEPAVSQWMTPARLARTCGRCEWFLVTPCPPRSRLLRRDACDPCWHEPLPGVRDELVCATAVAAAPFGVAIADAGAGAVILLSDGSRRLLERVPFARPGPLAYSRTGTWLVVDLDADVLRRLDASGFDLGPFRTPLPVPAADVERVGVDSQGAVWLASMAGAGRLALWRAEDGSAEFAPETLASLREAFAPTGIARTAREGFCLAEDGHAGESACAGAATDMMPCGLCFSWYGRTTDLPPAGPPRARFGSRGQILTLPIDSGKPRCRWHRVRADALVPRGTAVSIAVATSEEPDPPAQGVEDAEWAGFSTGVPHPADWQELADPADCLVRQPPGRYLFLRLRLSGDGRHTPSVRRIRLDFPRRTTFEDLPFVYRETPDAEDFGERFLSLFDALIEQIDASIVRFPALFDPGGVPEGVLPWLGTFLDVAMDPAWDEARRRRILAAAPKLYRMRGTVDGMKTAIRLVFDVDPVVQELSVERPWGAVGEAHLGGGVRLFGRSSWRFSLGRSRLSRAPLRSFGNPDRDPFQTAAHRFHVFVPAVLDEPSRERLSGLIEALKPAHTLAVLRDGRGRVTFGAPVRVGIDTSFRPFPPSVLAGGAEGVQLNRSTVLSGAPGSRMPQGRRNARLGVDTVVR